MQDVASEFSKIFREWYPQPLTARGGDPLPHPARPLARRGVQAPRCWDLNLGSVTLSCFTDLSCQPGDCRKEEHCRRRSAHALQWACCRLSCANSTAIGPKSCNNIRRPEPPTPARHAAYTTVSRIYQPHFAFLWAAALLCQWRLAGVAFSLYPLLRFSKISVVSSTS